MNKEMDYIIEGPNGEALVVEQANSRNEDGRERLKAARKKVLEQLSYCYGPGRTLPLAAPPCS